MAVSSLPRVLIIAEAANPEMVSVPLVGWSLANALRQVAHVHIVTQVRNRDAFMRSGLIEGSDFTAIDSEAIARPIHRLGNVLSMGKDGGWTTKQALSVISYAYFERLVWKRFGAEIQAGAWDIVHRITPLTPTKGSFVAPRCKAAKIPFIIGPLNGGIPWPDGFNNERLRERELLSYVRKIYKVLPGYKKTLSSSAAILCGSRHTMSEIPTKFQDVTIYLPENAIDPERFNSHAKPGTSGRPLKACFVGRLVPVKGLDMLIEAAAPLLRAGTLELDIVGDGPLSASLKALVTSNGVDDAVRFHGWLAHQDVQTVMEKCDLLTFPSIKEFGGGVVLEAMALGIPPLVVNYGGPGELVQSGWGFTVPIGSRQNIIADLRVALERCVNNPAELACKGEVARERVASQFTWARKAEQVAQIYDWVLNGDMKHVPVLIET